MAFLFYDPIITLSYSMTVLAALHFAVFEYFRVPIYMILISHSSFMQLFSVLELCSTPRSSINC